MAATVIAGIAGLAALTFGGRDYESAGSSETVVTMAGADPVVTASDISAGPAASTPTNLSTPDDPEGSVPRTLPGDPVLIQTCQVPGDWSAVTADLPDTAPPSEVVTVDLATVDPNLCYSTSVGLPFIAQVPHYVLADASFVPVEVNFIEGDANPSERGVKITYLRETDGGVEERMLTVSNHAADLEHAGTALGGVPIEVTSGSDDVTIHWVDDLQNAIAVSGAINADDAVATEEMVQLAVGVQVFDNDQWSEFVRGVQLDPLPPEMQAWREAQIAEGFPAIQVSYAYG